MKSIVEQAEAVRKRCQVDAELDASSPYLTVYVMAPSASAAEEQVREASVNYVETARTQEAPP